MTAKVEVRSEALRLLPALERVGDRLAEDTESLMERAFPADDPGLRRRAIIARAAEDTPAAGRIEAAIEDERMRLMQVAERAVAKLRDQGDAADLDDDEGDGLEAIINLTARPAIRIVAGSFLDPPPPWEDLIDFRQGIEATACSVGRVQVQGNPLIPYAGTAFVVADGVVMTNRHVAKVFASIEGSQWVFEPGMTAGLDWADDPDEDTGPEFSVTGVIGVHPTFDLALLEVEGTQGSECPRPLTIASQEMDPLDERKVYALGYPAFDPRNGAEAMRLIFGDVYNVKRLQPGEVMVASEGDGVFHHDCSTLGGNSGSCVIDLESNLVLGLHFSGKYLKSNRAVALWRLTDDPLLTTAGANFA